MTRRSPCDCEHCTQDRLYRQKEVTRLYAERTPQPRMRVSPSVDRRAVVTIPGFLLLAIVGVAVSWWVHR